MRALIKSTRTPFLGLLGELIPQDACKAIEADIQGNPGAKAYGRRLEQHPALFAVWLASRVMRGLGATGRFEVYPFVQEAIGVREKPSNAECLVIWRTFRRAILRLGIQPLPRKSGTHFIVDEFVRQAGVPVAFADDLARKMLVHAKRLGVPHEDDQEALLAWQTSLLNRLRPPFSVTTSRAVGRDANAYYTQAFLRVLHSEGRSSSADPVEAAFAKAFVEEGGAGGIKRSAIPQLLYRDGVLGLLLPAREAETTYRLSWADGSWTSLRTQAGIGEFRALPEALPPWIAVETDTGEHLLYVDLWVDKQPNRFLVFNEQGRLRATGQLGKEQEITLLSGAYVALCRFAPTEPTKWSEVSEAPRLVEVPFDLQPGHQFVLANGPAQARLEGSEEPTVTVIGAVRTSLEQVSFYFGPLEADVVVPSEWHDARFEVRITAPGLLAHPVSVPPAVDGASRIDLAPVLSAERLSPGLHRVVIELARTDDARALHRQSMLFWAGLQSVSHQLVFEYSCRPANLVERGCVGIRVGHERAAPAERHGRTLRLTFTLGGGRVLSLSWNRPGLFIDVEIPGADGTVSRVNRPLGATETVSLLQQKTIAVSGSEPGQLVLGDWSASVDFTRSPTKYLPGAFLASRMRPGASTLLYRSESRLAEIPLLELSQPHVFAGLTTDRVANIFEVKATIHGEPTDFAVVLHDMREDRVLRCELALSGAWTPTEFGRAMAYSATSGPFTALHVAIDVHNASRRLWVGELEVRIAGQWGRLEDDAQACGCFVLQSDEQPRLVAMKELAVEVAALDMAEVVRRLRRTSVYLCRHWSRHCGSHFGWLSAYWSALAERCEGSELQCVAGLVDCSIAEPPDGTRPGWLPGSSVGARLPKVFALPGKDYGRLNRSTHPIVSALSAISSLPSNVGEAFGSLLHVVSAAGFENVKQVMQGEPPRGFCLQRFAAAVASAPADELHRLDESDYVPPRGELLGPLHLEFAWRDLSVRYQRSIQMPTAAKSAALAIARGLNQRFACFDNEAPRALRGKRLSVPRKAAPVDIATDAEEQAAEHQSLIAVVSAWFAWHCRLAARRPEALDQFVARLRQLRAESPIPGEGVESAVTYFLQVAPAMFGFYLLLFETVLAADMDLEIRLG